MSVVPVGMVGAAHVSHADVQPAVATKVVGASTLVTALSGASPASAESCAVESACDEEQAAKRQLASGSAKNQERSMGANLSEGGESYVPATPQPDKGKAMDELEKSWLS